MKQTRLMRYTITGVKSKVSWYADRVQLDAMHCTQSAAAAPAPVLAMPVAMLALPNAAQVCMGGVQAHRANTAHVVILLGITGKELS